MVDFASVYNLANKPTEPMPDWVEQQKGIAQLNYLNQATQSNAFDLQKKQQSLANAMALKNTYLQAKNPEDAMNTLVKQGRFDEAKTVADTIKSTAQAKEAFGKVVSQLNDAEKKHIQESSEFIGNQARVAMSKMSDRDAKVYWQNVTPLIFKYLQDNENDGPIMKMMKEHAKKKIERELPEIERSTNIRPILQDYIDNSKNTLNWLEENKPLTETGRINTDEKRRIITKEQADAERANSLTEKDKPEESIGDVSKPLEDPGEERIAQLIAKGKMSVPPISRNKTRNLRLAARADAITMADTGEGFDASTFPTRQAAMKYYSIGKGADAFRQQDTILHHAKTFKKAISLLDNNDIQSANNILNKYNIMLGDDKANNYNLIGQVLSSEVGKYLAGGNGSMHERQELANLLPMFASPKQAKGAITTLETLVEGQRKSWEKQRKAGLERGRPAEYGGEESEEPTEAAPAAVKPSPNKKPAPTKPVISNSVKSLF